MDLVSILIPAYKPEFFRPCLTSALAQTWENKEIIVSDDCPTDAIEKIVAEYAPHVTYIRNPTPGLWGINNLLHLSSIAKGDYFKFIFDDDVLHPFCTQYLVEALEGASDRNALLAFSPRKTIDSNNHTIAVINPFEISTTTVLSGDEIIRRMARTLINPVGELTTVLFRRRDILRPDGTLAFMTIDDELCLGLADVAVFVHLCAKGNAVVVPEMLSFFRVHPQSNSNPDKNGNWPYLITDWRRVIDVAARKGLLSKAELLADYLHLVEHIKSWQHAFPSCRDTLQKSLDDIAASVEHLSIAPSERHKLQSAVGSPLVGERKHLFSRLLGLFSRPALFF